jgi:N-acetylglucosamine kinase-like BadF-type ATPase
MNYYLGFDGGGTKTDCALMDSAGGVLGEGTSGPSNPLRVGYEAAFAALNSATEKTLRAAKLEKNSIRAVCAALAGAGRPGVADEVKKFLSATFPGAFAHVASDFEAALEAAAGAGAGVVLIAGTGSAAFGRNAAGELARAGGYGPAIGDEGSAFDIGRRAFAAAARARDRGEASRLAEALLSAARCAGWDELIERVAARADDVFPRVFPAVAAAAESGDVVARDLLLGAAESLADLANAVMARLNLREQEFVLAKSGGVFGHSDILEQRLDTRLASLAPRARISQLKISPAIGAAQIARRLSEPARP